MRAAANAAISEENRWPSVSTNGEDREASNPKARVITAGSTPGQQRVRAYLVVVRSAGTQVGDPAAIDEHLVAGDGSAIAGRRRPRQRQRPVLGDYGGDLRCGSPTEFCGSYHELVGVSGVAANQTRAFCVAAHPLPGSRPTS